MKKTLLTLGGTEEEASKSRSKWLGRGGEEPIQKRRRKAKQITSMQMLNGAYSTKEEWREPQAKKVMRLWDAAHKLTIQLEAAHQQFYNESLRCSLNEVPMRKDPKVKETKEQRIDAKQTGRRALCKTEMAALASEERSNRTKAQPVKEWKTGQKACIAWRKISAIHRDSPMGSFIKWISEITPKWLKRWYKSVSPHFGGNLHANNLTSFGVLGVGKLIWIGCFICWWKRKRDTSNKRYG